MLDDAVVKFAPRLVPPAVGFTFEGVEVVGDKYCNGRVDVCAEFCNDARSDHTPLVGGRGS